MEKEYCINLDLINSVLPAKSNDIQRYGLCGVYVEDKDGFRHYTATNGHVLLNVSEAIEGEPLEKPVILGIKKSIKFKGQVLGSLRLVDNDTAVIKTNVEKLAVDIIDTQYPDFRKILPAMDKKAETYVSFNPDYMKIAVTFIPSVTEYRPYQETAGSACMWVNETNGVTKQAVVMPMRLTDMPKTDKEKE